MLDAAPPKPSKVPARIEWAIQRMALASNAHVLEIGCGRGVAAGVVCEILAAGRLTAMDRSATAIAAAREANRQCLEAGRLELVQADFLDIELGRRFGKAFAINVNAFWTDPQRAAAPARSLLTPGGRLHLVYEPPSDERAAALAEDLPAALRAGGFGIEAVDLPKAMQPLVGVTAVAPEGFD